MRKIRHTKSLTRKRRNSIITGGNCRIACRGRGIRDPRAPVVIICLMLTSKVLVVGKRKL